MTRHLTFISFTVIQSGTYTSHQLKHYNRESSTNPQSSKDINDTPWRLPPFFALDEDGHAATIYQLFLSALSSSFANALAVRGEWAPFGSDSCIRVPENSSSPMMTPNMLLRDHGHGVQQLCLDVRWSLSGMMTISCRGINHPQLSRLSDVLHTRAISGGNIVNVGDAVFLSPFGSRCAFAGHENDELDSYIAGRKIRATMRALLESCEVHLSTEPVWVCLQSSNGQPLSHDLKQNLHPERFWWPAHLCYVFLSSSRPNLTEVLQRMANGTFVDPLAEVEQWFLERGARDAIIAVKRKDDEERRIQESRLPESGADPQEDNEITMARATRTEQYLSAQEASGIYPTPPDGLTSHTQGLLTSHDSIGATSIEAHLSTADDQETTSGSGNASPITDMTERQFRNEENQDLFEDMDTDMFDANGLTEADFNFFDEPDTTEDSHEIGYEHSTAIQRGSLPSTVQHLSKYMDSPSHTSPVDKQMQIDQGLDHIMEGGYGIVPLLNLSVFPELLPSCDADTW